MPFNKTYTDLPLWAARDEGQGYYIFGTTINGADIQLDAKPIGFVDPEIAAAQEAQAQAQAAAPAAPATPEPSAAAPGEPGPGVSTASEAEPPPAPGTAPAAVGPETAPPPQE